MSAQQAQAALRMRELQWALDEAAHRMPRGEVPDSELENLADRLVALAHVLRSDVPPEAIDGDVVSVVVER